MIPVATFFPAQKRPYKDKNLEWMKRCVDYAQDIAIYNSNTSIRESMYNKQVNYNMYNDILDQAEINKVVNPFGLTGANFPAKMQNYPTIATPKIDLLAGEESSRKFDWTVRVMNMDAIMDKQQMIKDKVMEFLVHNAQMVATTGKKVDEKVMQEELAKLEKWRNFEAQDIREMRATQILKYLYRDQEMKVMFNRGFYDVLIAAEEIYCTDIISKEPIVRRVNPLNLFTIRQGESPWIEDSDMIIEYGYYPIGEVVDRYYEYLEPEEIDDIEAGHLWNKGISVVNYAGRSPILLSEMTEQDSDTGALIEVNTKATKYFGGAYDTSGNIRVVRILWKSLRKLGKLKYYDPDGDQQETIVDENYIPDVARGEEITWFWVGEWWEGTKIGNDIYVKMGPRPVQFRSINNISKCSSGYVGLAYNVNNSKAKSLMDRLLPFQYLYNVFMYRTELAFAKSMGKIGRLDLSRIPDGWPMDKWIYYAQVMGWAIEDSFKEGNKGAATGKLAGNMQPQTAVMDLEMGAYIQQHISMLQYIEKQAGTIAGISPQREAAIDNRETLGGVEKSIQQSSYITEHWFLLHEQVKARVLTALLETAKEAWKGRNIKKQYILDDMSSAFIDIDGDSLKDSEYGVFVNCSSEDNELFASLKSLAQAGIQNDKLSFGALIDIYTSGSISQVRRKIEAYEAEQKNNMALAEKAKQEEIQQKIAADAALKQSVLELDKYKVDTAAITDIRIAEMQNATKQQEIDSKNAGVVEDGSKMAKVAIDERKALSDQFSKNMEHNRKTLELHTKDSIEREKLNTAKHIAALKAETDKYKADVQLKIAKENKNKFDKPRPAKKK